MAGSYRLSDALNRDLYVLQDEDNPHGTKVNTIYPSTVLDQVFDDSTAEHKTLRKILEELRYEILTGGLGNIVFPVTSINGQTGDVVLTPALLGLDKVDNTSDAEKPLSRPQRDSIMTILSEHDFKVDLDDLYNHIMNLDNPHKVTLDQINKNGAVDKLLLNIIDQHNTSTLRTIHPDIRRSLSTLWNLVDRINNTIEDKLGGVIEKLDDHFGNYTAHANLFKAKEDTKNKAMSFTTSSYCNHTLYPSTRAVSEHVTQRLEEFKESLPDVQNWIDDIEVIDNRDQLPGASTKTHRKMYFIRNGVTSHDEIAVCRQDPNGSYSWDFSTLGTYSKFDPQYFMDSNRGYTISIPAIVNSVMASPTLVSALKDTVAAALPTFLESYYTKTQIDAMHLVNRINIIPGTADGTIRWYINDDESTMSDDVRVSALQRLAFKEWVTEKELWDQSVHERHILTKAIARRHIQDKAVGVKQMECAYNSVIGNTRSPSGTANEIPISDFAEIIRPYLDNGSYYIHPDTHPATMITEDTNHRFVTDAEKEAWNRIINTPPTPPPPPTPPTNPDANRTVICTIEVPLIASDWDDDNTQTVTVNGVNSSSLVFVSAASDSINTVGTAGIRCIGQDTNQLTFRTVNEMTSTIYMSITFISVS